MLLPQIGPTSSAYPSSRSSRPFLTNSGRTLLVKLASSGSREGSSKGWWVEIAKDQFPLSASLTRVMGTFSGEEALSSAGFPMGTTFFWGSCLSRLHL